MSKLAPAIIHFKCWFCRSTIPGDDAAFDREFDTDVHLSCIITALEENPDHPEARIMAYLLEVSSEETDELSSDLNGGPGES